MLRRPAVRARAQTLPLYHARLGERARAGGGAAPGARRAERRAEPRPLSGALSGEALVVGNAKSLMRARPPRCAFEQQPEPPPRGRRARDDARDFAAAALDDDARDFAAALEDDARDFAAALDDDVRRS